METSERSFIDKPESDERDTSENSGKFTEQDEEIRPWYSTFTGSCIAGKKWKKMLVHLQCGEQIVLDGIYVVKPIMGRVHILGYWLDAGQQKPVFSPRHHALLDLSCGVHAVCHTVPRSKGCGCVTFTNEVNNLKQRCFLTDQQFASLYIRPGCRGVVLELTPFSMPLQDVLLQCKIQSLYMNLMPLHKTGKEFSTVTSNSNSDEPYSCAFHFSRNVKKRKNAPIPMDKCEEKNCSISDEKSLHSANHEDVSKQINSIPNSDVDSHCDGVGASPMRSCDVNECFVALRGAKPVLASMEPSHIVNVPSGWIETVGDIIQRIQTGKIAWACQEDQRYVRPGTRILVVGERGVGKSTFVRYLVNSLLNLAKFQDQPRDHDSSKTQNQNKRKRKVNDLASDSCKNFSKVTRRSDNEVCITKSVCLLDLDCGQPEISLPGSVSVGQVSEPLLGPALIYRNSALRSHSEISANIKKLRTRKTIFNQLKNKLYPHLNNMQKQGSGCEQSSTTDDCSEMRTKTSPTLEEITMLQNLEEMVEELECETLAPCNRGITKEMLIGSTNSMFRIPEFLAAVEELMDSVDQEHSDEPLIVNTMGWTRNEGLLLLAEIIRLVEPVFVLHLVADSDDDLGCTFMDNFYGSESYINFSKPNRVRPVSYVYRFDYNYFQLHLGSVMRQLPRRKHDVMKPSRADLRHLSIIAYFSSLWTSSANNLPFHLRPCRRLSFARFGLHSLEREQDLFTCPGTKVVYELVSLCCTDKNNLLFVAEDLPLRYSPPKLLSKRQDESRPDGYYLTSKEQKIILPLGFSLLAKYSHIPFPKHLIMRELEGFKIPPPRKNYRTKTTSSELSTHQFTVIGWGVLTTIDRAASNFEVLTPLSEHCLQKANLVVRSQLQLPYNLKTTIVANSSH
ncbi:Polyribonucleotide 5'-hydroxyl-kinase Clp1 P-loop domain [Trinorchestia longiramus]|nr:Polyribonucleotide 5'-hydroxyl-kinase Clp1 P-loop domain [Trinorchestia longiramus]